MNDIAHVLPEAILAVGAVVLLLFCAWVPGAARQTGWAAVLLLGGAGVAAVGGPRGSAYGGLYSADAFAAFAKILVYSATSVCILIAPRFFDRGERLRPEYPVLVLLATAGAGAMISATDLLTLYVGLELQSLASYVLASFMRRDTRSAEAGLKYFVLGALASGILLYGISLVYGFTGTTGYAGIGRAFEAGLTIGQLFGLVFVFAGIAFKIAAVPFHMWTPDVYEGAPTPVTTLFATAQKVAAVAMLVRIAIEPMGAATGQWRQIVIFSALASIILGAAGAIGQLSLKRLLAYSSINNIGFALIGLAAGTPEGTASVLTYMAIYVVMTLGSFLCLLQLRDQNGNQLEDIASLTGLWKHRPGLAAALSVFMFSLAGIPPLFGFWPKLLVFEAAVDADLIALAVFGAIGSVIGCYYYLKIIKTMLFDAPGDSKPIAPSGSGLEMALITLGAVVIAVGYPLIPFLDTATAVAAKALF